MTLKSLRELRGFKPGEFADAVGISRPYLVNIEAGRKKLTNVLLARMADTLAVPQIAIMRPDPVSPDGSTRSSRQEVPGAAASTTPTPTKEEVERVSA